MQRIRLVENILEGKFRELSVPSGMTAGELKTFLKADNQIIVMQGGRELEDSTVLNEEEIAVAKIIPGAATTIAIISAVVAVVSIGVGIYAAVQANKAINSIPKLNKIQSSPSVRGSNNSSRPGERVPVLLGQHRVYPDMAALPFSSYVDSDQYITQLYSFGYSDVSVDMSSLKIGETAIDSYEGVSYSQTSNGSNELYPTRVIENVYGLELKEGHPIVRATSSNTLTVLVGLAAPSGLYKLDGENEEAVSIGIKIEWKPSSVAEWTEAVSETITEDVKKFRKMYSIVPSGAPDGIYDIRVSRTTASDESAYATDYLYLDVIQCHTGKGLDMDPVRNSGRFSLLALRIKASEQLNGVVDELNAVCTLNTRKWNGVSSGDSSSWIKGPTRNPASAILYLLTSSEVNSSASSDDLVDWTAFEDFYQFCEERNFYCDAWVTGDFTIRQLCEFIASSNMAQLLVESGRISIRVDRSQMGATQLFTPRNAWGFSLSRLFEEKPTNLLVKFLDKEAGYVETERCVSVLPDGSIGYDSRQEGESMQVETFGVTDPEHAARLGAQRLKELYARTRTYEWKSDMEGVVCLPGDVVYIENDNFLFGLGEGRIRRIWNNDAGYTAVTVDEHFLMEDGKQYAIRIRLASSGKVVTARIATKAGRHVKLTFLDILPLTDVVSEGDLVAFGEVDREVHKVLLTSVTPDRNHSCSFSGVDYAEEIYDEDNSIPPYDSGISRYPDDGGCLSSSNKYVAGTRYGSQVKSTRYLGCFLAFPQTGLQDGDYILLNADIQGGQRGHLYRYSESNGGWSETADSFELATALLDAQSLKAPENNPEWTCFASEEYKRRCTLARLNMENNIADTSGDAFSESFQFFVREGVYDPVNKTWKESPEFFIRTGKRLLLGLDGNFQDTLDGGKRKRALVNASETFAMTDTSVYAKNLVANGLSADHCNLHGNIKTDIFINPALICQHSSRGTFAKITHNTQGKDQALALCRWAENTGIPFDCLLRAEIGGEPNVGWALFHTDKPLGGTWGSSEINCTVYFYNDDGYGVYTMESICTQKSREEQNTWIFGWPWFGTHTVYYWETRGGFSYGGGQYEPVHRGIGGTVPPVQSVNPNDFAIEYNGYGAYRNGTGYTGVSHFGDELYFKIWMGSNYDLFMPQLPSDPGSATHLIYAGADNVLRVNRG